MDAPALRRRTRGTFTDFERWVEPQLADGGELAQIVGWGSKLPGAMLRIAGLLHLAKHALTRAPHEVPITTETMDAAVRIARYFAAHALTYYDVLGDREDLNAARELRDILLSTGDISRNDLYQRVRGRVRFQRMRDLNQPLATLEDYGWIRLATVRPSPAKDGTTRGRPVPMIKVNPLPGNTQKPKKTSEAADRRNSEYFGGFLRATGTEEEAIWLAHRTGSGERGTAPVTPPEPLRFPASGRRPAYVEEV